MLRLGAEGAVYLVDGAVTHAECRRATDLDGLIVRADRIGAAEWRQVCEASGGRLDTVMDAVAGRLSRAEFEVADLAAIFDAAFFLATSLRGAGGDGTADPGEFEEGTRHRLEPVWRIAPATLDRVTERRRARLHATWPSAAADHLPVTPVTRVRRQRVILSGLQAEILLNADGRRTPCELARELGRPAFGCLLAVRELAAAELLEVPGAAVEAAPMPFVALEGSAPDPAMVTDPEGPPPRSAAVRPAQPVVGAAQRPATAQGQHGGPRRSRSPGPPGRPPLPVRKRSDVGATQAGDQPPAPAPTPPRDGGAGDARWAPVDHALLVRVHSALRELG